MGDELMALGEARAMSTHYGGGRVSIVGRDGLPRWNAVFQGAPYVRQQDDARHGMGIRNGPGCRPYIDSVSPDRFVWSPYQPLPADLRHIAGVDPRAEGRILIEPNLKPRASINKQWPHENWLELGRALDMRHERIQVGAPSWIIARATVVSTPSFEDLVRVMRGARLYVGHEGGLHHLAAALGVPAVVIFGGYIWPRHTGYRTHINLTGGAYACGSRQACKHCAAAMQSISVGKVLDEITRTLSDD